MAAEPHNSASIRVSFVPFDAHNPYQGLLSAHFPAAGVSLQAPCTWSSLPNVARDGSVHLHLHWPPSIGINPLRTLAKLKVLRSLKRAARRYDNLTWTVHNLIPHDSKYPALDRWFSRSVAHSAGSLIVHSKSAAQLVTATLKLPDDSKVRIIPHGHYLDAYPNTVSKFEARARLGLDQVAPVFLFFGAIRPYKGLSDLLDAWQRLSPREATLIISGRMLPGAASEALRARIRATPAIRLYEGFIPDGEVQVYFSAADAVVFPYRRILTSGAVVLAMSFGRACVAPQVGTISDYVSSEGAFFFGERDSALHDALDRSLHSHSRLAQMGAHNLQRARRWDWNSIAQATAAAYRRLPFETDRWW